MKKYRKFRVLAAHPFLKEGLEFNEEDYVTDEYPSNRSVGYVKKIAKDHPTWFEEIDSRWKPEEKSLRDAEIKSLALDIMTKAMPTLAYGVVIIEEEVWGRVIKLLNEIQDSYENG